MLKNSKADDAKENSRISFLSLNSGKVFCGGSHIRFYCYAHVSFLSFFCYARYGEGSLRAMELE